MSLRDRAENDVTLMRIPKIQCPLVAQYFHCVGTPKLGSIIDVPGQNRSFSGTNCHNFF